MQSASVPTHAPVPRVVQPHQPVDHKGGRDGDDENEGGGGHGVGDDKRGHLCKGWGWGVTGVSGFQKGKGREGEGGVKGLKNLKGVVDVKRDERWTPLRCL